MLVRTERRPEQRLCCVTQSAIWVGSSITRACGRITSSDRPHKPWYDRHGEAAAKSGRRRSRQRQQRDRDHDDDQRDEEQGLVRKWSGKGERHKPSYRSVTPLDSSTITYVQLSR